MKYVNNVTTDNPFVISSINGIITDSIVNYHVELTLEDNSMIIMNSIDAYYRLIEDNNIDYTEQVIKLDELVKYITVTDAVTNMSYGGEDVISVSRIEYKGYKMYLIQRNGTNPISAILTQSIIE